MSHSQHRSKSKLLSRLIIEAICFIFLCFACVCVRRKSKVPLEFRPIQNSLPRTNSKRKLGRCCKLFISKSWLCLIYANEFILLEKLFTISQSGTLVSMACIGARAKLNCVWKIFWNCRMKSKKIFVHFMEILWTFKTPIKMRWEKEARRQRKIIQTLNVHQKMSSVTHMHMNKYAREIFTGNSNILLCNYWNLPFMAGAPSYGTWLLLLLLLLQMKAEGCIFDSHITR